MKPRQLLSSLVVLAGCTSTVTGTGTPSAGSSGASAASLECPSIQGTWLVRGPCGDDSCAISQTECDLSVECAVAGHFAGSISGSAIVYSGESADGYAPTCTSTLGPGGRVLDGKCTRDKVVPCLFTATRVD